MFKIWRTDPYAGVRGFGSHVNWQDNQANPGVITGHAHGNISLVAGLPVQITKDVRFEAEGRFVNETAVTAGFTIAIF
jgi:predicted RNA binding protein YcfA (HicA-like mRNA interferase family)